jgi:oligopeptidase B
MQHALIYASGILFVASCTGSKNTSPEMNNLTTPIAKKNPHEFNEFGNKRTDNYFWLNERENTEVIKYLEAENDYTDKVMAGYKSFRKKLYSEMRARIKEDDISVPFFDNGYYYYTRFEKGDEHARYMRCEKLPDKNEIVLLNVNELAKGKEFCEEASMVVSPDNQWLAYTMDLQGRRKYDLYFKNLQTHDIIDDGIKNTAGDVAWCLDNKTVFYTLQDAQTLRSYKIMRHEIGTPVQNDVCVYEEKDETYSIGVYTSKSQNYVLIYCHSTLSNEVHYLDANNPKGKFTVFTPREKELEYGVDEWNNTFYIRTNLQAKNFRVMTATPGKTKKDNWTELVAHENGTLVESFEIFNNYLVIEKRIKGLVKLHVLNLKTKENKEVAWTEDDYTLSLSINQDAGLPFVRVAYSSLKTPASVYDIDLVTLEQTLKKQQEVPGGYNAELYNTQRVYIKSRDGKEVPVSVIYRKDKFEKNKNPLLVYGYGAYGVNIDPAFVSTRLSLLDRGFVYAIAHIRGSQTLGREWYEDGKMLNKKNSFNDFIDCTESLIKLGYANKEKVFAMGASAGGLLMGAVTNMRPDLYKGILAGVPFIDVITTMLDKSVPLTTGEYDEWGNPNDSIYYKYMLSYSPYDNVEKKNYPAMLVTTGLHDSQVQYWEPAKWVAKLRACKTNDNILLLHTNMKAGHGGSSGRFEYLEEVALEYAFMFMLLDIRE